MIARRFLDRTKGKVSKESVRSYLSIYMSKAPKTYNNQLDGLRAFTIRFLKAYDLMDGFREAPVNSHESELPDRGVIQKDI